MIALRVSAPVVSARWFRSSGFGPLVSGMTDLASRGRIAQTKYAGASRSRINRMSIVSRLRPASQKPAERHAVPHVPAKHRACFAGRRWIACASAASCWSIAVSAQGVGGEELLAAGGLALAANGHVLIEEQDVTISADRIRVVNVVRNTGERDVSLLVTFALPDLETLWIWDAPPLLPRSGDVNFVDAATTADGERVTPRLEQRAIALGLDVTDVLKALGLPSFPYANWITGEDQSSPRRQQRRPGRPRRPESAWRSIVAGLDAAQHELLATSLSGRQSRHAGADISARYRSAQRLAGRF